MLSCTPFLVGRLDADRPLVDGCLELVDLIKPLVHLHQIAAGQDVSVLFLNLLDVQTVALYLDTLSHIVVAHMVTIEHQLHKLSAGCPFQMGGELSQMKSQVVTDECGVVIVGEERPMLALLHPQPTPLAAELQVERQLGAFESGVASSLDENLVREVVIFTHAMKRDAGRLPSFLVRQRLAVFRPDFHNR